MNEEFIRIRAARAKAKRSHRIRRVASAVQNGIEWLVLHFAMISFIVAAAIALPFLIITSRILGGHNDRV